MLAVYSQEHVHTCTYVHTCSYVNTCTYMYIVKYLNVSSVDSTKIIDKLQLLAKYFSCICCLWDHNITQQNQASYYSLNNDSLMYIQFCPI